MSKRSAASLLAMAALLLSSQADAARVNLTVTEASRSESQLALVVGLKTDDNKGARINGYTLDYDFEPEFLSFKSAEQLVGFGILGKLPFSDDFDCSGGKKRCQAGNVPTRDSAEQLDLFKLVFDIVKPFNPRDEIFRVGLLDPRFNDITPKTGDASFDFGRSVVSYPVPEPSTALLLASGLAALAARRRSPRA